MRKSVNLVLVLCLPPFLWQCVASQQEMQSLDLRLRTMDNRMVELNRNITNLENRTSSQAAMGSTLDRLEAELLQLKGRLDENAYQIKRIEEENNRRFQVVQQEHMQRYQMLSQDLEQRLTGAEQQSGQQKSELADQISTLKAEIHQLNTQLGITAASLDEMRKDQAREAAEQAAAAARAAEQARTLAVRAGEPREIAPEQPVKRKMTGNEAGPASSPAAGRQDAERNLYEKAYSLLKADRHKEAYGAFSDFLEKYPNSSLAPNARFWIGDSLFNQKEYELAILEYQKVIANYPTDPKASAGLLKQGMSFENLKDRETAKIIYQKLLKEYPSSEQAKTAQARLNELK